MTSARIESIREGLLTGNVIPYLGSGLLTLSEEAAKLPYSLEALADKLTAKASVPHKIRKNPTAAAQFIENFKHRKTVKAAMIEAFTSSVEPTPLHTYLASIPKLKLMVHAWYDDLPQKAFGSAGPKEWGVIQGVSQAEHFGQWVHYFKGGSSENCQASEISAAAPLLYQPFGSVSPAGNFLVSDSDFVEVLTEIDIQTPIPEVVQNIRKGRNFLFLGCRFATQLERIFAHQILKRSSDQHFAVLPEQPTRNEVRFLTQYNVEVVPVPLAEFATALTGKAFATPVLADASVGA